jgi:hypothetical protein
VLERWIDALDETGRRTQVELCIVDSGSTPAGRRLLRQRAAPRVDVVCGRPNLVYECGSSRMTASGPNGARRGHGHAQIGRVLQP